MEEGDISAKVGFGSMSKEVKGITEKRDEGPALTDQDPLGVQQSLKLTYNSMLDFFVSTVQVLHTVDTQNTKGCVCACVWFGEGLWGRHGLV